MFASVIRRQLNEYLPLKQGLRLASLHNRSGLSSLNEYLPLKQGLRRLLNFLGRFISNSMSIFH